MAECTCPADGQAVPKDKRVILYEPGAVRREGNEVVRDLSKVHIFHADCPAHGYRDVTEEGKDIE